MSWQDLVLTIINITFSVSLVPQVYYGFKTKTGSIKLLTSTPTFIGLFIITYVYTTLNLFFAATLCFCTGVLWFLLFLQRVMYKPALAPEQTV